MRKMTERVASQGQTAEINGRLPGVPELGTEAAKMIGPDPQTVQWLAAMIISDMQPGDQRYPRGDTFSGQLACWNGDYSGKAGYKARTIYEVTKAVLARVAGEGDSLFLNLAAMMPRLELFVNSAQGPAVSLRKREDNRQINGHSYFCQAVLDVLKCIPDQSLPRTVGWAALCDYSSRFKGLVGSYETAEMFRAKFARD